MINPGDEVLYHEPCYVSYRADILFAHGIPVVVETKPEQDFRLTREMLEKKVTPKTKLLLLNFPNNPTGAILPRKDVEEVAAFVKEHDLLVITDEIYAELTYDGEHVSIASFPGMKERTIFLHGFSKAWAMTGFRLGYACAPAELTEAMMKVHQYTMLCAPTMSQKAAIEALTHPEFDVSEMRSEYHKRRNYHRPVIPGNRSAMQQAARGVLRVPVHRRSRPDLQGVRAEISRRGKSRSGPGQCVRRVRRRIPSLRIRNLAG